MVEGSEAGQGQHQFSMLLLATTAPVVGFDAAVFGNFAKASKTILGVSTSGSNCGTLFPGPYSAYAGTPLRPSAARVCVMPSSCLVQSARNKTTPASAKALCT